MTGIAEAVQMSTHLEQLAGEILQARLAAHAKHGENSIERTAPADYGRWLAILGEEHGEICRAATYDGSSNLRDELVDLLAVASAWLQAIDETPDVVEATIYCGASLPGSTILRLVECTLLDGHNGPHVDRSGLEFTMPYAGAVPTVCHVTAAGIGGARLECDLLPWHTGPHGTSDGTIFGGGGQ